jgi:hypothetical protein
LGLGAFYENETLNPQLGSTDPLDSSLWRGNFYLIHKQQINQQARFYNTLYF